MIEFPALQPAEDPQVSSGVAATGAVIHLSAGGICCGLTGIVSATKRILARDEVVFAYGMATSKW